ncbi:MAG: hypothetical protein ACK4ZJ_19435, partial [Allorhizobium sp.]
MEQQPQPQQQFSQFEQQHGYPAADAWSQPAQPPAGATDGTHEHQLYAWPQPDVPPQPAVPTQQQQEEE